MKTEAILQKQIVQYLRQICPSVIVAASMNGMPIFAKNAAVYVKHQKAMGMLPGDCDLRLHWLGDSYFPHNPTTLPRTLFLEIKSPKGKPSPNQIDIMTRLTAMGFPCELVRSFDEFLSIIKLHNVPSSIEGRVRK